MGKKSVHEILAHNLKLRREERGFTQTELGNKAGCGQSHISRIERREMPTGPTIEALTGIAQALGLMPWELLVDDEATRQEVLRRAMDAPRGIASRASATTASAAAEDPRVIPFKKGRRQ